MYYMTKVNAMNERGTRTLLLGPTGTGKTFSCRTFVTDCNMEAFFLFTEPSTETLDGTPQVEPLTCEQGAHYCYIPPAAPGWETLLDNARQINRSSYEALAKMEHINKSEYNQMLKVIEACANFKCDRCEKEFGPVDSWDTSRAFVLDSLSGLNIMASDLVVGSKPVKNQGQWQVAMDNIERFVNMLTSSVSCYLVMTAHLEREVDEVAGTSKLMASTLGRKFAPRLPRFFSDAILCVRDGATWHWDTINLNVDLKSRTLPFRDDIKPTFANIVRKKEAAS